MQIREQISGLLLHLNRAHKTRRRKNRSHLRGLLVEQLEGRRLMATIDINALSVTQGTTIFGADAADGSGFSVSGAGDFNGDGYDDFLIGAFSGDAASNLKSNAGESYLVFGGTLFGTSVVSVDLNTLGTAGIKFFGADSQDYSGTSVSSAGDLNGDGFDDLVIGASFADASGNAKSYAGESYVIYGTNTGIPQTIDLSNIVGLSNTKIFGADAFDQSGFSVSNAGDFNGDGIADLLIGANQASGLANGRTSAGDSYLIFGNLSMPATINLASLGTAGINISGAESFDQSGYSVSAAGDVNGDGFADLVIGATGGDGASNAKSLAGDSFVLFGGAALPSTIDLATLGTPGGAPGITIFGAGAYDESGISVSNAGDVNGDGFDDLLVGARYGDGATNTKSNAGESYVIFGGASLPATIDLNSLGSAGVTIFGADTLDQAGFSVSSAGDVNGDGYDDLIIGAIEADSVSNGRANAGESYVIFGGPALPTTIDLFTALGSAGITIFGRTAGDKSGTSVSSAGDVNGDGFDDLIIGAFDADASGDAKAGAGDSYIIYGGNGFTSSVTHLGTTASETLTGSAAANIIVAGRGNDILVGSGGADVLMGGQGNDILAVSDTTFRRAVGGTGSDTLRLDGSGMLLDLETLADNRIVGIETIDLTGSGNNTLMLNRRDALNISDESNVLTVIGDAGDRISTLGWSLSSTGGGFNFYNRGNATLKVSVAVQLQFTIDLTNLTLTRGSTIFGAENIPPAGIDAGDQSGYSVSNVGDFDRDGFDDIVIGAFNADGPSNARTAAGDSYLVFGSATLPSSIDLATLGTVGQPRGITIVGAAAGDFAGWSVSGAGDMNGDGYADLAIGAKYATSFAGKTYVIYGEASPAPTMDLATPGIADITLSGISGNDFSGYSVSTAGDVNGDGYDDLMVSAPASFGSGDLESNAGELYLIYGGNAIPSAINLATLGSAGVTIFGADAYDAVGGSLSAGDIDGDGYDDLIIGAYHANALVGETYIIYGGPSLPTTLDLGTIGSAGTLISGIDAIDGSGISVSNAGDVNGDGYDDLIIGAATANAAGNAKSDAGESYVIYGSSSRPASIDLTAAGITIFGADADDLSGRAVSGAGDVNGDGYDDLLIGAHRASGPDNGRSHAGESYLVFGGPSLPTTIDLANLGKPDASNPVGITIFGVDVDDNSGFSVSSAGDVNGDGFDDLLVGAYYADSVANGRVDAGESYIIYGRDYTEAITLAGTASSETLEGTASVNTIIGGRGNDTLVGNGGADVLTGGQGDDVIAISDVSFNRILGGNGTDTLRFDGTGLSLDLTTLLDNRLLDIETIDITGSGNNTLTLNKLEVLNISGDSNKLVVMRNAGDVVNIGSGWTQGASQTIGSDIFSVYTQGSAILWVETVTPTITITSVNRDYNRTAYVATASITDSNLPTPTLTFTYYSDAAGTTVISAPTNQGTYYVRATTAANEGNNAAQSPISLFVISPFMLTTTGLTSGVNKTYSGNTTATANVGLSGVFSGDTMTATVSGTFSNKNVGVGKTITVSANATVTLNSTLNALGNYTVTNIGPVALQTTANITAKALTVTARTGVDKVYNGNNVAGVTVTLSGIVSPDIVTGSTTSVFTAGSAAGNAKAITSLSNATVTLAGADSANYSIPVQSGTVVAANITPKALTVTATANNKVYNATNAATISYSGLTGFIGTETVTVSAGTGTFADKNVTNGKSVTANAPVLVNGTNGGLASNYSLATPTGLTANITAASISAITGITADNKIYDTTTTATLVTAGASFTGKFAGDTLTVGTSTGAFIDKDVANGKSVNITGLTLSGADAANYTLASTTASTTADITAASISAITGITANNKVYDATTSATLVTTGASFTGKFVGDTLTVGTSTGNFIDKNAASGKTVNITGLTLSGADAANYTLASTTASTTADITVASISAITGITANNKVYDATTAATLVTSGASFTGKFVGDTLAVGASTGNFVDKDVANGTTVNITGLTLSGADAANYTLASTTASATADITVASISAVTGITANNKVYDATTAATLVTSGASFTGKFAGDTLTVGSSTGNFVDKNAANGKSVNISGLTLSGADAANYTLASTTASATADITVASISAITGITANNKVYDATTAATLVTTGASFTGKFAGDTLTVGTSTGDFVNKDVANGKTVNITGLTLSGADAANYTLASTTASATADITVASISAITGITANNKVYDATTAATLVTTGASFTGKFAGDTLTVGTSSGSFVDKTAANGKTVNITSLTLSGADAANYTLASTTASATADITVASISAITGIAANNKVYDATTAATLVTGGASFTGKFAGDTLTVGTSSGSFVDKTAANGKSVNITGLTLSGADAANYALASTTASTTANITAKAITGTVVVDNKAFDGTTNATILTRTLVGVILGDVVTYNGGTATFNTSAIGAAKPVSVTGLSLTGTDALNYSVNTTTSTTASILVIKGSVFYNASAFESPANTPAGVTAAMDNITSKTLLQSGTSAVTTTFANVTNYNRGINGLVFDVGNVVNASLSANDFTFRVPNGPTPLPTGLANPSSTVGPTGWQIAPAPNAVNVITTGSQSRIRLEWLDGVIKNTWLQVIVKANANTGLALPAVFYIGNAIGEVNGVAPYRITSADVSQITPNVSNNLVSITNPRDIDKSRRIATADISVANPLVNNAIVLNNITIPAAGSGNEGSGSGFGSLFLANESGNRSASLAAPPVVAASTLPKLTLAVALTPVNGPLPQLSVASKSQSRTDTAISSLFASSSPAAQLSSSSVQSIDDFFAAFRKEKLGAS